MRRLVTAVLLLAAAPAVSPSGARAPAAPAPVAGIPVARLTVAENVVEQSTADGQWVPFAEGSAVRLGDRLRTGPQSTAYLEFPWMGVVVGPGSVVALRSSLVLALVLEEGRVEPRAEQGDMIKLYTAETQIRGKGRVVVRRQEGNTLVTVVDGRFRVEAGGKEGALDAGQGSVVSSGQPARALAELPAAPAHLFPGADPIYTSPGQPIALSWTSTASAHHLQLMPIDSDMVLLSRDVGASPERIQVPWPGTYRWRVSARNARGVEGLPSTDGLICVVAK